MNADGTGQSVERIAPKNLSVSPLKVEMLTGDLRYMLVGHDTGRRSPTKSIYIYDRETKMAREITRRAERTGFITANGDWFGTNHGEVSRTRGLGGSSRNSRRETYR